ncbi:MAG: hypothetical protein Q8N04_17940 [Nitrospira sp.]|nr:hypothetical protein [Nitrospira sp.]
MTILLSKSQAIRRTLALAAVVGSLSGTSAWGHDEHATQEASLRGHASQTPEQHVVPQGVQPHGPAMDLDAENVTRRTHQHGSAQLDSCPQVTDQADLEGLKECVTVLTQQISDLLKLIMNLSDALAESRNELMLRTDQPGRQSSMLIRPHRS